MGKKRGKEWKGWILWYGGGGRKEEKKKGRSYGIGDGGISGRKMWI